MHTFLKIWVGVSFGVFAFLSSGGVTHRAYAASNHLDVDLSLLDTTISPCEDFYQYACGGWLKTAQIPEDRPIWNRSFSTIDQSNREKLKTILESYAKGSENPANPYAKKLGDYYAACTNEGAIEKNSLGDLKTEISKIDALTSVDQLAPLVAHLHLQGVDVLFDFGQEQDAKDSTQVVGVVDQGGKGLPDRDYYLKDDAKMSEIRKLYHAHIARVFGFVGTPEAQAQAAADSILKTETALAQASLSRVDRRDPLKVYHRLERSGLKASAPLFGWDEYFNGFGMSETSSLQAINVAVPDFVVEVNTLLKTLPLDDLKTYLKWHLLDAFTEALPKKFVDEKFAFVSSALSGQKKIESRWKRCVRSTDSQLGFALGRSFVEVAYGAEGKTKSQKMIQEIESVFEAKLKSLPWMDDATRTEALRKLSRINNKIGYPDRWRSYDGLQVDRKSFFKSLLAAREFNAKYDLAKIGKPVDRNEWHMTPPMVNAYYSASMNEIVFPAGILQYPFFNRESTDTANSGAIGVVMGHELTHGFDDQGRKFNADGNLVDWWSGDVAKNFEKNAACVDQEYSAFEALPGVHVNGKLTLGENIADNGGMALAYSAWRASQMREPSSDVTKVTDEQKYFIAYGQSWCQKEQEQYTRMRVTTDPHSPSRARVNGVVSQFPPFAKAFACKPNSPMAPENRCKVW